ASLGDDYRCWARVVILARRNEASPGERVAVPRHFSPETLELSDLVSPGARQTKASERT
ncbi:hypothetical protein A2U01_0092989, partial [Trifolium medium]|nr:hypothetical protein [Trifolium medium]